MAKNNPPRPGGAPPRPGARPRPGAASRPGAPARPPATRRPGGRTWSPDDAAPEASSAAEGEVSETLEMVPLTEQHDHDDAAPPSSATTFFAIPQPKRKAKEEPPPPTPAAGPPPAAAPPGPPPARNDGAMPPGPPPMGSMPPGMMGGMGIQGPIASGPVAGPVAGYPGAAGMQAPVEQEIDRARSYRVFALVAGLMFMVFSALIIATGLTVGSIWLTAEAEKSATPATVVPPRPVQPMNPVDTGALPPKPEPPKPKPTVKPSPKPSGPPPAPKPAPPPVGPAPITVNIPPSEPFTSIEVNCPSGYRQRASFSAGTATLPDVPREDCVMRFKGGPPAKNKISGGQTKNCTFQNGMAVCGG